MAEHSIFDIANWFLIKESMNHIKLQKLCYYAVAWGYALLDKPICIETEFQAWINGPVSPVLYEKYKKSGWKKHAPDEGFKVNFDEETEDLLESVWFTYGEHTANSLIVQTHSEIPWKKARAGIPYNEHSQSVIDPKEMKEFYLSVYEGQDA